MLSSANPLDSRAIVVSVSPVGIVKLLEVGWNINKFCNL